MTRKIKIAVLAIGVAALAAGCSQGNTEPDQVGLHYQAGSFSSTQFESCIAQGTREWNGPGDKYFYYPAGLRTYKFTSDKGADDAPITFVSSDNIEMSATGFVSFTLNTSCDPVSVNGREYKGGTLQAFNETIGMKDWGGKPAYIDGDDYTGWDNMLDTYIGQALQRAVNDASQGQGWKALYNDPSVKAKWEAKVKELLPVYIKQATGADFFKIDNVSIQKPQAPKNIVDGLAAKQQAELDNQAQKARNEKIVTELDGIRDQIKILGPEVWLQKYAIDSGKVTVYPLPQGSSIIANGGAAAGATK